MKKKIILSITALALMLSAYGQKPVIELTFTAIDNSDHVQLDSIKVMNRTQGGDTVLYWPDTVLMLDYQSGIAEVSHKKTGLQVFQNYPNPAKGQTTITLYVPEKDKVNLMITDMMGRQLINAERILDKGLHSFLFVPKSGGLCFFTAHWKGTSSSIKILYSSSCQSSSLEYVGSDITEPHLKVFEAIRGFKFSLGDTLLYIGYTNTLQSGMLAAPGTNETYTFQFATNIPCPETPTVTYEGQVYNTIQIFGQCWLKENLNVGSMIPGNQEMGDNGVIEKYCYDNEEDSCTVYGGLYQWDEMMQYTTLQGVQGICPPGWHIPTDEEWKTLEGAVDSQYGIGDPEWDYWGNRGFDVAINLKSTSGWFSGYNGIDLFGFSGIPAGLINLNIGSYVRYRAYWWTATEENYNNKEVIQAWYRRLECYGYLGVLRDNQLDKKNGFSVRCIRN